MFMGFFYAIVENDTKSRYSCSIFFWGGEGQYNKYCVRDFYEICTNRNLKIFKFILIVSLVD